MTSGTLFFALCAVVALLGAVAVVASQNAIRSAVGLLATILGIAGLYIRLSAQFLAAIQVIVYAGAVVVLFVFVIMLLGADFADNKEPGRSRLARAISGAGIAVLAGLALVLLGRANPDATPFKAVEPGHGSIEAVGTLIFTQGIVPFEIATVLLIGAAVGAVAVSRSKRVAKSRPNLKNPQEFFAGPVHPRDAERPLEERKHV
jgi:NADH-quinone oxidoreductase subunit J